MLTLNITAIVTNQRSNNAHNSTAYDSGLESSSPTEQIAEPKNSAEALNPITLPPTIDENESKQIQTDIIIDDGTKHDADHEATNRMKLEEILGLLDLAVKEVCTLMITDSLTRFASTKQYQKFYQEFGKALIDQRNSSAKNAQN